MARKPGIALEGAASDFSYSCRAVEKAKEGGLRDLKPKIMNQADPLTLCAENEEVLEAEEEVPYDRRTV
jgi:hypothetical protein